MGTRRSTKAERQRGPIGPARWTRTLAVVLAALPAVACAQEGGTRVGEASGAGVPVIGGPCEGCEAVFVGMPADPPPTARIAPADEPGEPLRIEGTAYGPDGEPAQGVILYAYHTDAGGVYPPAPGLERPARRHGRLRAWVRTGPDGRYRFDTIRPGGYPGSGEPQHVHMHVVEPGCCTYWIASIHFADDPRLDAGDRRPDPDARGGPGLVHPTRDDDGVWRVTRDVHAGRNVPGHPGGG